jgi:hypothetical protein
MAQDGYCRRSDRTRRSSSRVLQQGRDIRRRRLEARSPISARSPNLERAMGRATADVTPSLSAIRLIAAIAATVGLAACGHGRRSNRSKPPRRCP